MFKILTILLVQDWDLRFQFADKSKSIKLVGSIPVVVGAPNIQDFAPSPNSVLHIKEIKDAESIANTMKYLAQNPIAYNESLRYASIKVIVVVVVVIVVLQLFTW